MNASAVLGLIILPQIRQHQRLMNPYFPNTGVSVKSGIRAVLANTALIPVLRYRTLDPAITLYTELVPSTIVYSVLKSSRFSGLSYQTLVMAWLDQIPFIPFIYKAASICEYDDLLFGSIFEFPACAVKGVCPVTFCKPPQSLRHFGILNFEHLYLSKEPVKSFVGMFRKMKISLYDN